MADQHHIVSTNNTNTNKRGAVTTPVGSLTPKQLSRQARPGWPERRCGALERGAAEAASRSRRGLAQASSELKKTKQKRKQNCNRCGQGRTVVVLAFSEQSIDFVLSVCLFGGGAMMLENDDA